MKATDLQNSSSGCIYFWKTWALCFPVGDRGVNAEDPTHRQCDGQIDDDQETADGTGGGDYVR